MLLGMWQSRSNGIVVDSQGKEYRQLHTGQLIRIGKGPRMSKKDRIRNRRQAAQFA